MNVQQHPPASPEQPPEPHDGARAVLTMPCVRHRVLLKPKWVVLSLLLGGFGVIMVLLTWMTGTAWDRYTSFMMFWVAVRYMPLMLLPLLPLYLRHVVRCHHVFERAADGTVTLEKQWYWHGRLLKRKPVDLSAYTWLRIKAPDFIEVTLELGNRQYLTYPLEVVKPLGRGMFLPEEIEADKLRLVAMGETIAQWTGIENRGFREYT